MKLSLFYRITMICIIFVALFSCQKPNDTVYSCDEKYQTWAVENKTRLATINRLEFVHMSYDEQITAFRTLTPSRRFELWSQKFDEIAKLGFSKAELAEFQLLRSKLSEFQFGQLEADNQAFINFCEDWHNHFLETYKWDEYKLAILVYTLYLPNEEYKWQQEVSSRASSIVDDPGTDETPTGTCVCKWGAGCVRGDACGGGSSCDRTSLGCGWFWLQGCGGRCIRML
jgi:hypothetical protein